MKSIVVLLTVHNRKEKTLICLENLFNQGINMDVYLVDDGSIDGTFDIVKERFPQINIIQGNGNLYWTGGMRLAWETAAKKKKYDYFVWLNDDTYIMEKGLDEMFCDYRNLVTQFPQKVFIITAACKQKNNNEFSYGGQNVNNAPVKPNGIPQKCKYINGNLVLIPYEVYEQIGVFCDKFTHALGDFDYGLRAQKEGIDCYTTSNYIAECDTNPTPDWKNPQISLKKRWKLFHSPKGLNPKEFLYYKKIHEGKINQLLSLFKIYSAVLFPSFYQKIKNIK
jgi:GT2 family glycosyltransferase